MSDTPPNIYASNFQFVMSAVDSTLAVLRSVVTAVPDGEPEVRLEHVLSMSMSPQAAKELHTLIGLALAQFEEQFGTIETPFTRSLKA